MLREELKNLLQSFTEEDFYSNTDLHIHSCESDGRLSPCEIVELAKKADKKYISICDHNSIEAYFSTNILKEEIIIPAVEFDCLHKGILIHILGYGIDIDNKDIKSLCAKSKAGRKCTLFRLFRLRNTEEVIDKIKAAGGAAVLAHPACCPCFNLESFIMSLVDLGIDGLEVYYPYKRLRGILKFHLKKSVETIADKYHLIKTGGTDTHGKKLLRQQYKNIAK